jgi:hypothetical protein
MAPRSGEERSTVTDYRLYPCPSCYRHVQPSTVACPFCGAALPPPPPAPPPDPAELRGEVTLYGAPAPPLPNRGRILEPMPLYGAPPPPRERGELRNMVLLYGAPSPPLRRSAARWPVLMVVGLVVLAAIGWLVLSRLAHVL